MSTEPKQELTSVDLAALVGELGSYEGAKVDKAYLYGDDLVRLKMRDFDRGRVELVLEVGDRKRVHTVSPERVPDAPGRPPQFAMMLRNRLSGADFVGVEQYEFDRILEFVFDREDGVTRNIVVLFGQGNVAVTDREYEVIDSLETVRLKSRTVVPGSRYEFPESRVNPLTVSREAFDQQMDDSDTDVVRTLATQLNFGGLYAEELCTRAGVEKTLDIEDADEDEYERIYQAIERLALDLRNATLEPRVYLEGGGGGDAERNDENGDNGSDGNSDDGDAGRDDETNTYVVDVTPFPLEEHGGLASEPHETFNGALEEYFFRLDLDADEPDPRDQRPDFEEQIAKHQRIIDQQEGAIQGFDEQAEAEREKAELLYAHYGTVDDLLSTVRSARDDGVPWGEIAGRLDEAKEQGMDAAQPFVDVNGKEGTVTIRLEGDPITLLVEDGVEKNADRLYTEAKRIAEKKEGALAAIEDTREELAEIERRRDEWEADDVDEEAADEEGDDERDWLAEPSVPIRQNEQWYERFRWFRTSDDYLVIGGRNADQNEELVKKYLERGDRVLHTQAHGGPVTVLKATDPSEASSGDIEIPDSSVEEAAQFAVSYSSVWKDGRYAGDVYVVDSDQVSKTPESGEYLEKGGFAIRGDRTYLDDTPVGVAVGIQCEPYTRVVGGPPSAIEGQAVTTIEVEPGRFAQADAAKRIYRELRERFADESFVRKIASPDQIAHFLPPGGSRLLEE